GSFYVGKRSKGTLVIAPTHTACNYEVFDDNVTIFCYFAIAPFLAYLEKMTDTTSSDLNTLHDKNFRDPLIQQLLLKLWDEAAEDNSLGSLFIDHTAYTLVSALLYKSERLKKQAFQTKGLTKKQMQQVVDHIHDRLTESLSLQDLSKVLGIQEWELARAFKKTTGIPPYKYVLEQRVYKAKELIETTALPLAQIALEVGFSSQPHLTFMFKKVLGYPPSALGRKHNLNPNNPMNR
ncbi:MAG: helix-turn-helix domain-containing protein, partial [Trueperaceae bacterium]